MSFFDDSEQQIAAAVSAAVSSVTTGAPLFGRSLSAPHLQFADVFMPCRSPLQGMTQDLHHMGTPFNVCLPESLQQFTSHPFDQSSLPPMSCTPTLQYTTCPPSFNPTIQSTTVFGHDGRSMTGNSSNGLNLAYHQPIHPFQMDQLSSSINNLESATAMKPKFEYQNHLQPHPLSCVAGISQPMEDLQSSDLTLSDHSTQPSSTPFRTSRGYSTSVFDSTFPRFEVPGEYPACLIPRHGSLGSLYPITQSHELLEPIHTPGCGSIESVPMLATASSSSISSTASASSMCSLTSNASSSSSSSNSSVSSVSAKSRVRRASLNPDASTRVFTCHIDDCGKLFRRSEHLKRHVRSVHTLEKPFVCPVVACPKRFSRSDNLSQHIRIHRHDKDKLTKQFNFTPSNPVKTEQA
ncbi:hypothetical protein BGZ65_003623, partial [Modicella reniformis]